MNKSNLILIFCLLLIIISTTNVFGLDVLVSIDDDAPLSDLMAGINIVEFLRYGDLEINVSPITTYSEINNNLKTNTLVIIINNSMFSSYNCNEENSYIHDEIYQNYKYENYVIDSSCYNNLIILEELEEETNIEQLAKEYNIEESEKESNDEEIAKISWVKKIFNWFTSIFK